MIKWGILGLGRAANSFAEAIIEVENAELVSIASLSKTKLNSFGKKFNIKEIIDLILI
jgi:predicted dehydrogenase